MLNVYSVFRERRSMPLNVEILTVGDELLRGDLADTNGVWLAERLTRQGFQVSRLATMGDPMEPLVGYLEQAAARTDLLLVTGGLGPTEDDRTAAAVARAAGRELQLDQDQLATLQQRFTNAGYTFTPNNEKQVWFPRAATVLPNERGTAPGFMVSTDGGTRIVCMPGVPHEMKAMFEGQVLPLLEDSVGGTVRVRVLRTFGIGESQMDHRLSGLLEQIDAGACRASLHFRTSFPENSVILVVWAEDPGSEGEAEAVLERLEGEVRERLGDSVYGADDTTFSDAVVQSLRQCGASVALAESCTGGLAGDLITQASGSSEVFELGVITYSNRFKHEILGVPQQVLDEHGAVSQACVEAMAAGVRRLAGSTYGVAISGIAGPTGGTEEKPVGTVHFALAAPDGVRHVVRRFPFDRGRVKRLSAYVALTLAMRHAARGATALDRDPLQGAWAAKETT
jgi:nicotinamide-nucleotide amidase